MFSDPVAPIPGVDSLDESVIYIETVTAVTIPPSLTAAVQSHATAPSSKAAATTSLKAAATTTLKAASNLKAAPKS
jgi:hypothetical protein